MCVPGVVGFGTWDNIWDNIWEKRFDDNVPSGSPVFVCRVVCAQCGVGVGVYAIARVVHLFFILFPFGECAIGGVVGGCALGVGGVYLWVDGGIGAGGGTGVQWVHDT